LDWNIEGLKNEYKFELEIRSSQIRTLFNNLNMVYVILNYLLLLLDHWLDDSKVKQSSCCKEFTRG